MRIAAGRGRDSRSPWVRSSRDGAARSRRWRVGCPTGRRQRAAGGARRRTDVAGREVFHHWWRRETLIRRCDFRNVSTKIAKAKLITKY